MRNPKTLFPYLFGLISLLISWGIATQGKPAEIALSPTALATTPAIPAGARWTGCRPISRPRSFFYIPSPTNETEDRVTITGTIYASDFSPLPDAIIEISQPNFDQVNSAYPPPARLLIRTDEAGRYGFTVKKPPPSGGTYLHYEIIYQEGCPFLMHMHLMAELPSQPLKQSGFTRVIEATGPVLRGPVDIVMPVPPPNP